jgi:hypothetical protein
MQQISVSVEKAQHLTRRRNAYRWQNLMVVLAER